MGLEQHPYPLDGASRRIGPARDASDVRPTVRQASCSAICARRSTIAFPASLDGRDNDCSGTLDYPGEDDDGDGWADCADLPVAIRDCNDGEPAVHPEQTELCNAIDDDCDSESDEGFDCTGTTPICSADRTSCAPCVDESDCPDRMMCLTFSPYTGACGQCNPAETDGCASGIPYCDEATLSCVPCLVDGHCTDSGFRCRNHECVCEVVGECTCPEPTGGEDAECVVGQTCSPWGNFGEMCHL